MGWYIEMVEEKMKQESKEIVVQRAAPELLAICKRLLAAEESSVVLSGSLLKELLAVVAKAEGVIKEDES